MDKKNAVVGVFDSGVGGLSVLVELIKVLPYQSFIYFADTENCPYGPKGKDEIIRLSDSITKFLLENGCCAIVVACNTATAAAIDYLRSSYSVPFVGMEPAIKPAALSTKTKSIGVLATAGTFNGRLYQETSAKYASGINIVYKIGNGLVELVEQGKSNSTEAKLLIDSYVLPMLEDNIDHLVLGCTHYPFFTSILKKILPKSVVIVNPAPAVAKQTLRVLGENQVCNNHESSQLNTEPFVHFFSSGETEILQRMVAEIEKGGDLKISNKKFSTVTI